MAGNTRESRRTVDEGEYDRQFARTGSRSRGTTSHNPIADEPLPIFLYDSDEEPEPPLIENPRDTSFVSSFLVKASLVGMAAAAIAFAVVTVDNPLTLFASAKASLIGASQIGASANATGASKSLSATRPAATAAASAPVVRAPANDGPTREEIAAAFKIARLGTAEIAPASAAVAPARRIDADELAALLKRAKGLIAVGDIGAARLLLERAADAQEASAALLLAQTYDPAVLGKPDMRSITPDPAAARGWYRKAAELGSQDAKQRLEQMKN